MRMHPGFYFLGHAVLFSQRGTHLFKELTLEDIKKKFKQDPEKFPGYLSKSLRHVGPTAEYWNFKKKALV